MQVVVKKTKSGAVLYLSASALSVTRPMFITGDFNFIQSDAFSDNDMRELDRSFHISRSMLQSCIV